jgi:glycosyltransferase involved in cell wall biosynthesis
MKRAVLISGDFVKTGGMDMPNFALAKHLANRGVSVQVVAHRIDQELADHPNVRWHKVPKPLNSYLLGSPFLDRIGRLVAHKGSPPESRVVVNGGNCQVGDANWVHYVHAAYRPESNGTILARAKMKLARELGLRDERSSLRLAKIVVVNSERTRRDVTTLLGVDPARIHTVYYGIDATRFYPPDDVRRQSLRTRFGWSGRPQVAFVGALGDRRKGFDTLFEAWANLCKSDGWDCDLVVVGHGAELASWQQRVREIGLAERIRFLGFRSDVPDILAASNALIAPTRYEAFGLGVHEALCTGLPAIVSQDAGVAELYPASLAGLLLGDVNSQAEIESKLKAWRAAADSLRTQVVELSTVLRQRTWETMATELVRLLE